MKENEDKDHNEIVFDAASPSNNKIDIGGLTSGQQTTKINTSVSIDS